MKEIRMTFGEHLEELRSRLIFAIIWLAASTGVCLYYGKGLMKLTMRPHESAIKAAMNKVNFYHLEKSVNDLLEMERSPARWDLLFIADGLENWGREQIRTILRTSEGELKQKLPAFTQDQVHQLNAAFESFGEQLLQVMLSISSRKLQPVKERGYVERFAALEKEIRKLAEDYRPSRFQRILGLGVNFGEVVEKLTSFNHFLEERRRAVLEGPLPELPEIMKALEEDDALKKIEGIHADMRRRVDEVSSREPKAPIVTKYLEGFMSYFKVGLIFGIFFALPLILFEMWKFIGAGLYPREQKYILIIYPFSILLFVSGLMFGYFWMVPFSLEFLAGWGADFADLYFTLENYINLFFALTVILGLVFQTPLVMIFLNQIGLMSAKAFKNARKYTMLGAILFATVVTPPDPLSWSLVAVPVYVLYELGIWICDRLERSRQLKEAHPDAGSTT